MKASNYQRDEFLRLAKSVKDVETLLPVLKKYDLKDERDFFKLIKYMGVVDSVSLARIKRHWQELFDASQKILEDALAGLETELEQDYLGTANDSETDSDTYVHVELDKEYKDEYNIEPMVSLMNGVFKVAMEYKEDENQHEKFSSRQELVHNKQMIGRFADAILHGSFLSIFFTYFK